MNADPWSGRLLTLADWEALPEDELHNYELARGVLEVSAKPAPRHQLVATSLIVQLHSQLPTELVVLPEVDIIVAGDVYPTVRAPDVCVVLREAMQTDPARFRAADLCLVVEILSPSTARKDRDVKFFEYAEAGIQHYWIVDTEPALSISAYQLVDGEYETMAHGSVITLTEPAALTIDLTQQ